MPTWISTAFRRENSCPSTISSISPQVSELYTGYALDGLGQRPNDDEIASVPDLDGLIVLPWNKEVAWFPADNTFKGEPYEINTRVALKKQLAKAAEMGFGMNLGIECELFVVKQTEDGKLEIPNADDNLNKSCYDVKRFMDRYTWLDKVSTTINDLGWDLYSLDHEDANSQFEFDFNYSDALTMCDRYIFFRLDGQAIRGRRRPAGDVHAQAVRRQDRQRSAFQHVAFRQGNRRESFQMRGGR